MLERKRKKEIPEFCIEFGIHIRELRKKGNLSIEEIAFKAILSLGELNLSTLIFLTKTVLEIPENNLLSIEILKKIETFTESLSGEIKYIRYVIYTNLGEIDKANFNLKEAYRLNPAIYDYFRDIFPTIPQLHVFKNMNAS